MKYWRNKGAHSVEHQYIVDGEIVTTIVYIPSQDYVLWKERNRIYVDVESAKRAVEHHFNELDHK